jgi:hypothetical protein
MIIFLVSVLMSLLYLTNPVGWTFPPQACFHDTQ